jgi:MHS family proline/betaine transporter-like MFS transporter
LYGLLLRRGSHVPPAIDHQVMSMDASLPRPTHIRARSSGSAGAAVPRSSLAVAALSTVVEWYDFTLYLFMATVMAGVFFGSGPASVLTTLAVFAASYVVRPLGALFFGSIGDRRGVAQPCCGRWR